MKSDTKYLMLPTKQRMCDNTACFIAASFVAMPTINMKAADRLSLVESWVSTANQKVKVCFWKCEFKAACKVLQMFHVNFHWVVGNIRAIQIKEDLNFHSWFAGILFLLKHHLILPKFIEFCQSLSKFICITFEQYCMWCWLIDWMIHWLIGCLADGLSDRLMNWLTGLMIGWRRYCLLHWLIDRQTDKQMDR